MVDLKLDGDIDRDTYLSKRAILLKTLHHYKESLANPNNPRKRADELTESDFTFARDAQERFTKGTPQDKRAVLTELGSNLTIRDKKLSIDVPRPFKWIAAYTAESRGPIEPTNSGVPTELLRPLRGHRLRLLRVVDRIRTYYLKQELR